MYRLSLFLYLTELLKKLFQQSNQKIISDFSYSVLCLYVNSNVFQKCSLKNFAFSFREKSSRFFQFEPTV